MKKTYVDVIFKYSIVGERTPLYIVYDGRRFQIDKQAYLGPRRALSGGSGDCWDVVINGQSRYLYEDFYYKCMFVEKKED